MNTSEKTSKTGGKPDAYINARGETVMSYAIFKTLKVDAVLKAIGQRWSR
jgi:hypothetical protein